MDNGASTVGEVPLVRKVRLAMAEPDGRTASRPIRRAVMRRDVSDLMDRLDLLHRSFPEAWELLDRVRLSGHVIDLLGEARGLPLALGNGTLRR